MIRRLTTMIAAAAAFLALGATAAHAGVSVDDDTPSDPQTLTVTVSSPPIGATQYTLAECNVSDPQPLDWGRDCNGTPGSFTAPAPVSTTVTNVTVDASFTDVSFVPMTSPQFSSTDCDALFGTDPCAVVVSWYTAAFVPLGAEKADLTF